jgi:hypothetical protein
MSQKAYRITIGLRWSSFSYEREGMQMLGVVQRGMQIGAFARLADGSYAQVNGDVVEPLNKSRVEFALLGAKGAQMPPELPMANVSRPSPATVVVVKKRRHFVLPDR